MWARTSARARVYVRAWVRVLSTLWSTYFFLVINGFEILYSMVFGVVDYESELRI